MPSDTDGMSSTRFILSGVLACAFLVAGCNDPRLYPPKTSNAGMESGVGLPSRPPMPAVPRANALASMLGLVPEGTLGLVYIPNVKQFEEAIARIEASTRGKGRKGAMNLAMLARQAGLDAVNYAGSWHEWSRRPE